MTDQTSSFTLKLEGRDDQLTALFAAFKRQVRSDVAEIEKLTANVQLFGSLDADVKKAAAALETARASFAKLRDDATNAGPPTKELARNLTDAAKAVAAAQKEFVAQSVALDKLGASLKAAGVDTTNLAAAEARLAVATKAAAAAAAEQAAKQATGFKTLRDIAPEVKKITDAYTLLASSGKLTFGELSTLQARASQQIKQLEASVSGLGEGFRAVRTSLIGFAVAFAGIGVAISESSKNFREFSTAIAAIDTIADTSKLRLAELENGVRKLSREMGVDAVDSAKALYDIIGSGIPTDNALQVLALSTQAARAGLTDVATAAKTGVAVLNGFGLQANQLDHVLDVLFQTVRDGVITFKEIGDNFGNITPVANAAKVSVEEVGAALSTLTAKAGISAPEAATAIARAISELAAPAPEAAEKMRELGITFNGLLGTIEQFSKLNLSFEQINKLVPETRAAKAVLAFAQNFDFLNSQVTLAKSKAGQMKAAYDIMSDTPQAQIDRFNSSMADLSRTIGKVVTEAALPFINALTAIANAFNELSPAAKRTTVEIVAFAAGVAAVALALRTLAAPINLLVGAFALLGSSASGISAGLTAASAAMSGLALTVTGFLGFKLGEYFLTLHPIIRQIGDVLGVVAGAFKFVADVVGGAFRAVFSFNLDTLTKTRDALIEQARVLGNEFLAAVTGSTRAVDEAGRANAAFKARLLELGDTASKAAAEVNSAVAKITAGLATQLAGVEQAISNTTTALTALVADLQKQVSAVQALAGNALATLAAQTASAITALKSVDVTHITDVVEIQRKAAIDRLTILQKLAADSLDAFNKEAEARIRIAIKSKQDLAKVEQEIRTDKLAVLQKIVTDYRAHVDGLLQLQREHLTKLKELEDQRRGIAQDADEKIREIRRGTLTDYQQYSDKVNEIDELLSKARTALVNNDTKLATEFANKAIAATSGIKDKVIEDGQEVVSASRASSNAIDAITRAKNILLDANQKNTIAEREGAAATAEGLRTALPLLAQFEQQLKKVQEAAAKGVKVQIEADVSRVTDAVDDLTTDLAKRQALLPLIADLKQFDEAIRKTREQLEKGIPVDLAPDTAKLIDAIKKVQETHPELKVETTEALGKIGDLRLKLGALADFDTKSKHTVTSNTDEVQTQIDALKKDTHSTHTVDIVVNNPTNAPLPGAGGSASTPTGFRRGGFVRKFARGGPVGKVPGVGNGDTVPATLRAGQFVMRKAAARFYGDGLMGAIAGGVRRMFGSGGNVTKGEVEKWAQTVPPRDPRAAPVIDPKTGFKTGDSFQKNDPPINFDTRQIPEEFLTAYYVLAYARAMYQAVGANNPLLGALVPAINGGITAVERDPTDKAALLDLLRAAETIGSNPYVFSMWGKTAGGNARTVPVWFVDWLASQGYDIVGGGAGGGIPLTGAGAAARNLIRAGADATGAPAALLKGSNLFRRFAGGGSTDTVPALLTPGEFVMSRRAVARFGVRFMDAVNRMAIPRASLAGMMSPPVARFATGGAVGRAALIPSAVGAGGGNVFHFHLDATDLLSEKQIRAKVIPVINNTTRRSR